MLKAADLNQMYGSGVGEQGALLRFASVTQLSGGEIICKEEPAISKYIRVRTYLDVNMFGPLEDYFLQIYAKHTFRFIKLIRL